MDEIPETFTTKPFYSRKKVRDREITIVTNVNESEESDEEDFDDYPSESDFTMEGKAMLEEDLDSESDSSGNESEEVFDISEDVIEEQDPLGDISCDLWDEKCDLQSKRSNVQDTETLKYLGQDLPHIILSPFKYFKQFLSDDFLDVIVTETNLYSSQKDINKPLNVTHKEMEQWIGLICYFSISKLPNRRRRLSLLTDLTSEIMSRDRFEAIKRNFHLVNNSNHANADNFLKIRPMIDHLRKKFQAIPMIKNLCVDKQLVVFKGKSPGKEYISDKSKNWGYKFFVLADEKGMTYDFIPYDGRIQPVDNPDVPDLESTSNIVLHLAQIIPSNMKHNLFFDNWFTSLPLVDHLASRRIRCCGTIKPSRLAEIIGEMNCELTKKDRGAYEAIKIVSDNSEAVYMKWCDNKVVNTISTLNKTELVSTVSRFDSKKKTRIEVECPDLVKQYSKSIRGVDLADQLISMYRIPIRSKKYYMRLVFHMIDMVFVNAWLMYRRDATSLNLQKKDTLTLATFKLLVALDLMKTGEVCNEEKKRGPSSSTASCNAPKKGCSHYSDPKRTDGIGHLPRIDAKRNRCKRPNCRGRTNVVCKKCNVNLCLTAKSNCFENYHE